MSDPVKDLIIRAAKTFAQAFLAALAVGIVAVDDFAGLQALAIASAAAALSAVMNLIIAKK
jgi:hypothetical protein